MSLQMDYWLKFQLICKPEQSGKTFLMIQQLIKDINQPITGLHVINIILCDNNLLLTKQTSSRVESELTKFIQDGIAYVELSSHERASCHDMKAVFHAIVVKQIMNIICCTNGTRMNDIYELVTDMNDSELTRGKFHVNIWLDEADKFIRFIDNTLRPIVSKYEHVNVNMITATPKPLFKKYKYINVLPIEETTTKEYHGWEDNFIELHPKKSCLEFAEMILTTVAKDLICPGTKWFIPATTVKESHEEMKILCVSCGMAVLCVNGDGIVLTLPDKEPIIVDKDSDINLKIQSLYEKHHLSDYPFAITGNICIGRGISIMSSSFIMDYAILSHYCNKNEASQLAGRMKGNIKQFPNYKEKKTKTVDERIEYVSGIRIYTTEQFNAIAIEWEKKSRTLAVIAHQREADGNGTVLDTNDFKCCDKSYEYICHKDLFDTFEEARDFLRTKEREMGNRPNESKKNALHCCEGYWVSSKLLKPEQTVNDLTKNDRLTIAKANTIAYSRCISKTEKGSRFLVLPVYESEFTTQAKYQVRYLSIKKITQVLS